MRTRPRAGRSIPIERRLEHRKNWSNLDLFDSTLGTFTRSTEASYLTGVPTDGTISFLSWAAINERRIENRADGSGSMLLMEAARTNLMKRSRALTHATWSLQGTGTEGYANSPDTLPSGTRIQTSGSNLGAFQAFPQAGSTRYAFSAWIKSPLSSSTNWGMVVANSASSLAAIAASGTISSTTWARMESTGTMPTATYGTHVTASFGRADAILGGVGYGAANRDTVFDLVQIEAGGFPSSPIRTTTAAGTRGNDILSYAVEQYPSSFCTRGFRLSLAFDCTSAESILGGAAQYICSFGAGTHATQLFTDDIYVDSGGGNVVAFANITFSRGQLLTLEYRPSAGTITLSGATTGNGTHTRAAWTFPNTAFCVGHLAGGSGVYARFSRYIEAL